MKLPRLLLHLVAIMVGAAIGLVVGYAQRSFGFRGYDLIAWITYDSTAVIWPALGALIVAGVWTLYLSKI
jgi:hypothetical protein